VGDLILATEEQPEPDPAEEAASAA
jgi:hypothetical protein